MQRPGLRAISLVLSLISAPIPAAAADPELADCVSTYDHALALKKQGELIEAHSSFAECTLPSCPGPVRDECAAQVRRLGAVIPTVVPAARARQGGELTDVRVLVNGRVLSESIDGRAHRLNPGPHQFRFETAGARPKTLSVVLAEGDRLRKIEVELEIGVDPEPAPIPTMAWVLGGVGLAGLLGFTYFGLSGLAEERDLESCEPACSRERTDDLKRTYLFADISLAIGIVALGGASYVFLNRSSRDQALVGLGGRF
jgi:hypothetical protein